MMGRVKDFYHEEICARAADDLCEPDQPSDLEMLHMDAVRALERYREARNREKEKSHEPR